MKLSKSAVGGSAKRRTVSTSQGRANFAAALQTVQKEKTVIGFDRYSQAVAALVPVEAVLMLAGRGATVEASVRDKIERMARLFLQAGLSPQPAERQPRPAPVAAARKAVKKKRVVRRGKAKTASRK
ncbi:MAG: hypothetical protein ABL883_05515 [Terricaulis sp.]